MQLTIPDCCLGEFCPGIDAEGHNKREDGTYYSRDNIETNAYHYHNLDGSVFYRYSDGSEYYRRKDGRIRFRPPLVTPEKLEGEDPTASPTPATADREWVDWPPQLNLSVKTNGSSLIIQDNTGPTITFEPVGSGVGVSPTPTHNGTPPLTQVQFERNWSQTNSAATFGVQGWVNGQAVADVVRRCED